MQPRNNKLLLILGIILAIVLVVGCVATLIGAGIIAWLVPSRVTTSTEAITPIEATVEIIGGTDLAPSPSLAGLPVYDVKVELGVGSPAMVEIVASGEFPSTCAQVKKINTTYYPKNNIQVELLIDAAAYDCEAPAQKLPISLRLPLNMVEMPAGKYFVNVNGVQAEFEWPNSPSDTAGHYPPEVAPDMGNLIPLIVRGASVQPNSSAPAQFELVFEGEWPGLCSQLASAETSYADQKISVKLLAIPSDPSCPADLLGLPFVLRIPLNTSTLRPGSYTVEVNGLQTPFDWQAVNTPEPNTVTTMRIVYIAADGNVILLDAPDDLPIQLTTDATPLTSPDPLTISYNDPKLSSDGKFVAYRRGESIQQAEGMSMTFSLRIVDLATFETTQIYEKSPAGFNWKPNTHLLAYIPELDPNYFVNRADPPNADLANYIIGYNADTGESSQLVSPERGYAMYGPTWSPNGRFLSFDEVLYMEGRGPFAYYDFEKHEYVSFEEPLGIYSWSPDGEFLAYDNLTYTAQGTERIFIRSRQGESVTEFSPRMDGGSAIMPTFSPQGERIAYLLLEDVPDSQRFTLVVQPYPQGEPVVLGEFENVYQIMWSADGTHIVFSAGVWGEQRIYVVDAASGAIQELGMGMQPTLSVVP